MRDDYKILVESKLTPVGINGDDVIYRCPVCEAVKGSGHLQVNYKINKYNCFKCDVGGSDIKNLLHLLKVDVSMDYDALYSSYEKKLDNIISSKSAKKQVTTIKDYSRDLKVLTSYYDQHTKPLTPVARSYLISRGLTDDIIMKLRISEGVNRYNEIIKINNKEYLGRDYSGRVMVPSIYEDNTISFFVGRDYTNTKNNKYLNPPKDLAFSSEDVYNLNLVESNSVIICEGVFTAITVIAGSGKINAVATYGKSISSKSNSNESVTSQGEKLLARKFHTYYIAYDADAMKNSIESAKYLNDRGANVKVVLIDPLVYGAKADINDIGYQEFVKLLNNSLTYDKYIRLTLLN